MPRVELKQYQLGALARLAEYLRECARLPAPGEDPDPAATAFARLTQRWTGRPLPYRLPAHLLALRGMPYVCLRVPTGGGKTLMACRAAGVAMREFVRGERCVVLWLAPSDPIVSQTLAALRDRQHPYRLELESPESLGPAVEILSIDEALALKRSQVDNGSVVIVGTVQSFKREEANVLRVGRRNPDLAPFFDDLTPADVARLQPGPEPGRPEFSLVNALAVRRPIVIMDEAHNGRGRPLGAETLARFRPACILEWTATPAAGEEGSNVLHRVTAGELKREGMVKLPLFVRNRTAGEWPRLLAEAVEMRASLEEWAKKETQASGETLRPILLIQAENVERTKELRTHLQAEMVPPVPPEQIKIATGELDDLAAAGDLSAPGCPVRFILTVQKLREGWDCPFAYVLCSLLPTRSDTAIEQIIGRVLRMPQARPKQHEALNRGYVFAVSPTPAALREELIGSLSRSFGLTREEAREELDFQAENREPTLPLQAGEPETIQVAPADAPGGGGLHVELVTAVAPLLAGRVTFEPETGAVTILAPLTTRESAEAVACLRTPAARVEFAAAAGRVAESAVAGWRGGDACTRAREGGGGSPYKRREPFIVPRLCVREEETLLPLEDTDVLDPELNPSTADADLPGFPDEEPEGTGFKLDVTDRGELLVEAAEGFVGELRTRTLHLGHERDWPLEGLISWLDWNIPHRDIPAAEMVAFLRRVLHGLTAGRGLVLKKLNARRYELRDVLTARLAEHQKNEQTRAFRELLLDDSPLTVGETENGVNFARIDFNALPIYQGHYRFRRCYHPPHLDELNRPEQACAEFLDVLPGVQFWARNPARARGAFSLRTPSGRFFPDFACQLEDGRALIVEYKGEHLMTDATDKRAIGAVWERRSQGRCLFVMPTAMDFEPIRQKVRASAVA